MRRRTGQGHMGRYSLPMFAVSALLALLSLGAVIQVHAMPVEAQTTEPWYAYKTLVGYNFSARVEPGKFYSSAEQTPGQLVKIKAPVEPPVFRRALLSRVTDSIQVSIPYLFEADRAADIKGMLRVDSSLMVPGIWQRHYPLVEPKEFAVTGQRAAGEVTFSIPIAQILADIEETKKEYGMAFEPVEVLIRPSLEVNVGGLREPVAVHNAPEIKVSIRSTTTEIDDAREFKTEKVLADTKVVPLSIPILGQDFSVAALRRVSMISLGGSLALAALLIYLRRRNQNPVMMLERLGPSLITVGSFDLPAGTALADVNSVKELIQLHQQTERPVIRVGYNAYLLDGTTCYRLNLGPHDNGGLAVPSPEDTLNRLATVTDAEEFKVDPWITEVQVGSPRDLLQLHTSTGKTVIRTRKSYHLIEGTVCFTYRIPAQPAEPEPPEPVSAIADEPQALPDDAAEKARRQTAGTKQRDKGQE